MGGSACLECERSVAGDVCEHCGALRRLVGYELDSIKVHHARGRIYVARDASGARVAIKELVFAHAPGIEALDAFEREARFLRALEHPAIPRFVASFTRGEGVHTRMYLVQELVDGESLAERLKHHQFAEPELRAIAREVLGILVYLQSLTPMVFHRDVKPANVIARVDGTMALVDFGAARDRGATIGATVVGTFGYMPVEQLTGIVDATSDLYALGMTLLHLATRTEPWQLDRRARGQVNASAGFKAFLTRLVHDDRTKRFPDAAAALRGLDAPAPAPGRTYATAIALSAVMGAGAAYGGWRITHAGHSPSLKAVAPRPTPAAPRTPTTPTPPQQAPQHAPPAVSDRPVLLEHPPMTPTKTCDFGLFDANPHCRRGALLVTYPTYVGGAGRVVQLLPGGKLDENSPVDLPDEALASFRFLAIAVDPRGPRYFVINSVHAAESAPSVGELWVRMRSEQSLVMEYIPLASDKNEMVDLRGIAFDTKRERLYVSTPYTLWAWDLGAPSWQSLASDMDYNLTGLAYSPDEDVIYAVKNGGVAFYRFAPDGKLLGRIPVNDLDKAKRPVHFFEQVVLDHGTLVMIGEAEGPNKLLSLATLVVDLKTGNVLR